MTAQYALLIDIQKLLPELPIEEGSIPAPTEVQEILDAIEAEVIAIMPPDVGAAAANIANITTGGKAILRQYIAMGAAIQVWAAGFSSSQLFDKVNLWQTQYSAFLKKLGDGGYNLVAVNVPADENTLSTGFIRLSVSEITDNGY